MNVMRCSGFPNAKDRGLSIAGHRAVHALNAAGERLLPEEIFNAVLVLLVVTSLLGPVLTELFSPRWSLRKGTH